MKRQFGYVALVLMAGALSGFSASAEAYFVRPYVQLGNGIVDGFVANSVTERSASFTSALQAEVSLNNGTIRNFLEITGPGAFGQSAGVMGDRVTVIDADNTPLNFFFDFDGVINAPARDPNLNSTLQIGISASMFVFPISAGATYLNFTTQPGALISQTRVLDFNDPDEAISNLDVQQNMQGNFLVAGGGLQSYDVFYSLALFVAPNSNPGTVTMDFMNTARAAIVPAQNVVFTSESGVFLGSGPTAPIPEPSTYWLMALGLAAMGTAVRRRQP